MGYTIGMPSIKLNNVGQKSKHCGSFKKVAEEALAERLGLDLDIDKELTDQNIYKGFKTAEELMQYSVKHIEELDFNRPEGARKIRSDAVVMCGTILKPPAEMMINLSREEQQKFLEDAVEDFSKIVREDNIKSVVLHFDERVPHAHVFWEPMTEDGRLCAKEMHNLKFFGRLNREMPEMLRKQGWSIDNCQAYDKAEEDKKREEMGEEKYREYRKEKKKNRGQDSNTFKSEAEKNLQEINSQIYQKTAKLDGINAQIEESERILEEDEKLRRFVQDETEKAKSELAEVQEQTQGAKSELTEVHKQIQTAKSELVAAIEIPPRPVTPTPPEEPHKKTVYFDKDEEKQYYKDKKQYDKDLKVYQSKTLPQATAAQAEWDRKYNLLKQVQDVHEEQQRTAEQQNQRAALQQKTAEALNRREQAIEDEVIKRCDEKLARSERYASFRTNQQTSQAYQKKLQDIFARAKERNEQYDNQSISTKQDRSQRSKPSQELGDR